MVGPANAVNLGLGISLVELCACVGRYKSLTDSIPITITAKNVVNCDILKHPEAV